MASQDRCSLVYGHIRPGQILEAAVDPCLSHRDCHTQQFQRLCLDCNASEQHIPLSCLHTCSHHTCRTNCSRCSLDDWYSCSLESRTVSGLQTWTQQKACSSKPLIPHGTRHHCSWVGCYLCHCRFPFLRLFSVTLSRVPSNLPMLCLIRSRCLACPWVRSRGWPLRLGRMGSGVRSYSTSEDGIEWGRIEGRYLVHRLASRHS
jgi:hypothetical protein